MSQTAQEYIQDQLNLEQEAREVLPYAFDVCTYPMGPLRQLVFACLSCTPPGSSPAGICYSCSISCHGSHNGIVELFAKRGFTCDCGTDRIPGMTCSLRKSSGDKASESNKYNQNFRGHFCQDELYEAENELGTMYQCLLGDVCKEDWFHDACIVGLKREQPRPTSSKAKLQVDGEENSREAVSQPEYATSNDGERECGPVEPFLGTSDNDNNNNNNNNNNNDNDNDNDNDNEDDSAVEGFPAEDTFEHFICWQCVENNPWLKGYAGTPGFLNAVIKKDATDIPCKAVDGDGQQQQQQEGEQKPTSSDTLGAENRKRKAEDELLPSTSVLKRSRTPEPTKHENTSKTSDSNETIPPTTSNPIPEDSCKAPSAAPSLASQAVSLFLEKDFRASLCKCRSCYPLLSRFPILLEDEETYEPPLDDDNDGDSTAHESLFDAGQKALNTMDRVKAIEGVMAYNMLKEKVRAFLKPFADENRVVGAEDVKKYFEELRGDRASGSSENMATASSSKDDNQRKDDSSDNRKEQSGY